MASRIVDLPAPVSPVIANSPVPFSGSAVRSISKNSDRLARFWPRMARMRMSCTLRGVRRRTMEGVQMRRLGRALVRFLERLSEQVFRIELGQAHNRLRIFGR